MRPSGPSTKVGGFRCFALKCGAAQPIWRLILTCQEKRL